LVCLIFEKKRNQRKEKRKEKRKKKEKKKEKKRKEKRNITALRGNIQIVIKWKKRIIENWAIPII